MRSGVPLFLLLAVLAGACGRGAPGDRVVAKVGERAITAADFAEGYRALASRDTTIHPGIEGRRTVLKSMVDRVLLEIAAREKYPRLNESQKIRLGSFRKDELTRALLAAEVNRKVRVGENDVRRVYDSRDTRYKVRHIFCPKREDAEAAMAMLRQGASFNAVAAAHSRDGRTASAGGEMDWFVPGRGPGAEFEAAAMRLAPGESSGIVETAAGFEIIRLEEKAPAADRGTFDAEKKEIDLVLQARDAERLRQALRRGLFETYAVQLAADAPSTVTGWLGSARETGQIPAVSPADSARALVNLRGLGVTELIAEGAFEDTAWVRERARETLTLADLAAWLSVRPPDLWPDVVEPWTVEKVVLNMAFDEVLLREALARKLQKTPEVAARFEERYNHSRVMRLHNFEIVEKVHPTDEEIRAVYDEGRDRYVWPDRHVVRTFTTPDSATAVRFAGALRAGESFGRAAERVTRNGVVASVTPESVPDTLVAEGAGELRPGLIALTAPGQVSGPLSWGMGSFTVFQLVAFLPRGEMTFEEAREFAERDAKTLGAERLLMGMLEDLRRTHPVTVDEALLEKIEVPGMTASGREAP